MSSGGKALDGEPSVEISDAARKRVAVEMLAKHERSLRRTARRYSICAADADDAFQRALEILLVKAPAGEARELVRWMQTVTKHEALAVRRSRERQVGSPPPRAGSDDEAGDWLALIPSQGAGPAERFERREAIARSREALRTLKPAELKALTLLAEGYSYAEIGEMTGFSRTESESLPRRGPGALPRLPHPQRERWPLRRAAAGPLGLLRRRGRAPRTPTRCVSTCGSAPTAGRRCAPTGRRPGRSPSWRRCRSRPGHCSNVPTRPSPGCRRGCPAAVRRLGDASMSQVAAAGGTRGIGAAALAKALAICAGTAGGAAVCVSAGVVPAPARPHSGPHGPPAHRAGGGAAIETRRAPSRSKRRRPSPSPSRKRRRRRPRQSKPNRPQKSRQAPKRRLANPRPPRHRNRHRPSSPPATAGEHREPCRGVRAVKRCAAQTAVASALGVFAALSLPATGAAAPLPPADLHVRGGDGWHARNDFDLRWTNVPTRSGCRGRPLSGPQLAGGDGRSAPWRSPGRSSRSTWSRSRSPHSPAPTRPRSGSRSRRRRRGPPPTRAPLRRAPPGAVAPVQPAAGSAAPSSPTRSASPTRRARPPVSGIRGYAVSVDRARRVQPLRRGRPLHRRRDRPARRRRRTTRWSSTNCPRAPPTSTPLAVSGSQVRSLAAGHALLRVDRTDPVTRLSRCSRRAGPTARSRSKATATDSLSGMARDRERRPLHRDPDRRRARRSSPPGLGDGDRGRRRRPHDLLLRARRGRQRERRRRRERTAEPPRPRPRRCGSTASRPRSSSPDRPDPEDPELIEARVSDPLSGPDPSRGEIAVRAAGSTDPYEALPTYRQRRDPARPLALGRLSRPASTSSG